MIVVSVFRGMFPPLGAKVIVAAVAGRVKRSRKNVKLANEVSNFIDLVWWGRNWLLIVSNLTSPQRCQNLDRL